MTERVKVTVPDRTDVLGIDVSRLVDEEAHVLELAIAEAVADFLRKGGDRHIACRLVVSLVGEDEPGDFDIIGTAALTTTLANFPVEARAGIKKDGFV